MTPEEQAAREAKREERRNRLTEAALQAIIVGVMLGFCVIAGFDRVDTDSQRRWERGSDVRMATLLAANRAADGVGALRADLGVRICRGR